MVSLTELYDKVVSVDLADAFDQTPLQRTDSVGTDDKGKQDSEDDSDSYDSITITSFIDKLHSAKKRDSRKKETPTLSSEILISIPSHFGNRVFTALIDSGCSKSLLDRHLVSKSELAKVRKKKQRWVTKAGEFVTHGNAKVEGMTLPQFTKTRKVTHDFHQLKLTWCQLDTGLVTVKIAAKTYDNFGKFRKRTKYERFLSPNMRRQT